MRKPVGHLFVLGAAFLFAVVAGCGSDSSDDGGGAPINVLNPDAYELNNSPSACSSVPENFLEPDLNLHNQFDEDYFCFSLTNDSFVVITADFVHGNGDIDIQLLDSMTAPIDSSQTQQNVELITQSLLAGQYFVRVYSLQGDTNFYGLEIQAQSAGGPLSPDACEVNDTPGTCCPLGNLDNGSYSATDMTIHDAADVDFYCFDVTAVTTVDIQISFFHSQGNLDMELQDSSQNVILAATSFTDNEIMNVVLPAGGFWIYVYGVGGGTNRYALDVLGTPGGGLPMDFYEPNDTPGACAALGDLSLIPGTPTFEALGLTIQTVRDEDYFCFTLSQDSNVTIDLTFTNSAGNLDLELLDAAQTVFNFAKSYTDNERLSDSLLAGDYIIRVYGVSAATNTYDLSINVFGPDILEPNDDPATNCVATGPLPYTSPNPPGGLTIHDTLDEDWFCFDLPPAGTDWDVTIDLLFQDRVGDLDMDLFDAQQNRLQFGESRDDNEQIMSTLPANASYSLRVFGFGGGMNRYDLNITAIPSAGGLNQDIFEPNNSFLLCENVGNLPWGAVGLTVHNSADSDYFCFTMTGNGNHTVTVDLTFLNDVGDLDLELYLDPQGQRRLIARADSATDNEQIVAVVDAQLEYAVRVYGYNGATNTYDIDISDVNGGGLAPDGYETNDDFDLLSATPPNPQFPDETSFPWSEPQMSIHNSLDEDYISFQVSQPRSVMVDLTFAVPGPTFDLDMAVLDDNRNVIARADSGTANESLQVNVADGIEYRIWIYGFQGAMNSYSIVIDDANPIPPQPDGFEPNDDCGSARTIPVPLSLTNLSIHDPATHDYYKVTLQNPDILTVQLNFTNALGDLDLELMDLACSTVIASSATTNNLEEVVESLLPGEYVIHVFTTGPSANSYRMDVFAAAGGGGLIPDGYEFNDDQASCSPITLNFSEPNLSIHSPIDLDYFCFTLGNTGQIKVQLRFIHSLGDVDVSLWCVSGGRTGPQSPPCPGFVGGSSSFTDNETIDDGEGGGINLRAGDYYIRAETAFGGTNFYEMDVTDG